VINRFATDPPPQEPASSMLPFSLSWVHANGDRHLCNTSAIRDCEAHRTGYLYVIITSEQSGIPCSLRLTLLSCQRPGLLCFLCARTRATKRRLLPFGIQGDGPPIAKREDERLRGARGGHRHRQQGACPSSCIWARQHAQRFDFFLLKRDPAGVRFPPIGFARSRRRRNARAFQR
jgi:hypothetical protein